VAVVAQPAGDDLTRRIVVYLTALHELGHALGLPHTNRFEDIMYAFHEPGDGARYFAQYRSQLGASSEVGIAASGLSAADIDALRTLYDD
jgi:predicted Zn-dependent protease